MAYTRGLHEVADGVWAYLQPDGGWGWSNAGLVDRRRHVPPGGHAVRPPPHGRDAGGDAPDDASRRAHRHGGQHARQRRPLLRQRVLGGRSEIISTARCAEEMVQLPPSSMAAMMRSADSLGPAGRVPRRASSPPSPSRTYRSSCRPARSRGGSTSASASAGWRCSRWVPPTPPETPSSICPTEGVVFTGDILFHGGHPIVWAGPVANWLAACDRVLELHAHGRRPWARPAGHPAALEDLKGYFEFLTREAKAPLRGRADPAGRGAGHRSGPLRRLERGGAGGGQRPRPLPRLRGRPAPATPSPSWARWPCWRADRRLRRQPPIAALAPPAGTTDARRRHHDCAPAGVHNQGCRRARPRG